MCFAGVNFGPNVPQSNQERLNRIDAIPPASSRAIRPANFVLTLPMITQIDREIDPDRDFGLVTFGIDLKHSIQDDHVLPSSEAKGWNRRSEEHTSELQSLRHLVCRLLLEKKK